MSLSANAFLSYDSVSDYLKETAIKSLDSIDFHSLLASNENANSKTDLSVAAEFEPALASRTMSSDSTKDLFMQAMLEILTTQPGTTEVVELTNSGNRKRQRSFSSATSGTGNLTNSRMRDLKVVVPVTEKPNTPCEPTESDVLLGRGGRSANHPGNKKYLGLKDAMQARYMSATKAAKTTIAQELVDVVNQQWEGRFLKLDTATDQWFEIDNMEARKKCSQALREINTPEMRAAKRARFPKKK